MSARMLTAVCPVEEERGKSYFKRSSVAVIGPIFIDSPLLMPGIHVYRCLPHHLKEIIGVMQNGIPKIKNVGIGIIQHNPLCSPSNRSSAAPAPPAYSSKYVHPSPTFRSISPRRNPARFALPLGYLRTLCNHSQQAF